VATQRKKIHPRAKVALASSKTISNLMVRTLGCFVKQGDDAGSVNVRCGPEARERESVCGVVLGILCGCSILDAVMILSFFMNRKKEEGKFKIKGNHFYQNKLDRV
jgi:hypothetical protein